MVDAARAFDENSNRNILYRTPELVREKSGEDYNLPWSRVRDGEMPPMMFQIRFNDGRTSSYAYGDVREVHCRDAGYVQLYLFSIRKIAITFEGRHLRDFSNLISSALIKSVDEASVRDQGRPESSPEIIRISVDPLEDAG